MTTPYSPTIRSQADLEQVWLHLLQPLGFSSPSLWMLRIDGDDRPTPLLIEINELPVSVDADQVDDLARALTHLHDDADPGGRWALLRSRPGTGGADEMDLIWAAALYDMFRRHGLRHDVVHLATDETVRPIPLDEVTGYLQAS